LKSAKIKHWAIQNCAVGKFFLARIKFGHPGIGVEIPNCGVKQ
jgi:hypothetical protein